MQKKKKRYTISQIAIDKELFDFLKIKASEFGFSVASYVRYNLIQQMHEERKED